MLTDFHETSTTGFFWWDNQNEGWQLYANFKTVHFVKYLTSTLMDFHKTFYNRPSMLTSKLHIFLNTPYPCWQIFMKLLQQASFDETTHANFKTAHFLKYLGSLLMDFHETSITGILLIRQLKWGQQPYANFKTAHFLKYLGSLLMDFHETSITGIPFMRQMKWEQQPWH